jgi:hypothetical protein
LCPGYTNISQISQLLIGKTVQHFNIIEKLFPSRRWGPLILRFVLDKHLRVTCFSSHDEEKPQLCSSLNLRIKIPNIKITTTFPQKYANYFTYLSPKEEETKRKPLEQRPLCPFLGTSCHSTNHTAHDEESITNKQTPALRMNEWIHLHMVDELRPGLYHQGQLLVPSAVPGLLPVGENKASMLWF